MATYEYLVREVVEKTVFVEADSEEEAEKLALEEDMSRNLDYCNLYAELLDVEEEE